jgi:hypothetical protein
VANWYCSSVDYAAVAAYQTAHVYAAGAIVRPTAPALNNERCYRTTAGGTSGGAEPAWATGKGSSTTDSGGVIWIEVTGNETWQAAGAWAAPHARLVNACVTAWQAGGDTVYVAANHAETQAASMSFSISQVGLVTQSSIVCVDNSGAGHVPPQAGDIRTSATVTTTGNNAISFSGTNFYCYGITFQAASGGSSGYGITLGTSSGGSRALQRFEACVFKLMSSSNGAILSMGQNYGGLVEWINCNLVCSAAQNLTLGNCTFIWRGGSMTTVGNSASLILPGAWVVWIEGVDFSAVTPTRIFAGISSGGLVTVVNCLFASGQTLYAGANSEPRSILDVISSDSAAGTWRQERCMVEAVLTNSTSIVRTAGASDGTTAISWQIVSSTSAHWQQAFESFALAEWNAVTGSNVTVTLLAIANVAALPNNDDIWPEVHYFGNAASPIGSVVAATKANVLAANAALSADTSAWDTKATARVNSHTYAAGDIIAVSSNPGRIFFCTAPGGASGSLPAGYATAVDGGSITDGGATFRAGVRFKLVAVLTGPQPQMAGYIRAVVKVAKQSTTFFVDPIVTLS